MVLAMEAALYAWNHKTSLRMKSLVISYWL